jgi:DtxR family Mn-dependent transcriptional regulator
MASENYLIAIRTLSNEGQQPTLARVAAHCGVSLPTMSEAARRLERDGLVVIEPRRDVELTEAGCEIADALLRRHRLIERWLTDGLGLDWAEAHIEAHRLEHAVSPLVEERIAASLGYPSTCPHGNPIRFGVTEEAGPALLGLNDVEPGSVVRVRRLSELAEDHHELMAYFEEHGFKPGARILVGERGPMHGPLVVNVDGREVTLGLEAASYIWVWPPEGSDTGRVAEVGATHG